MGCLSGARPRGAIGARAVTPHRAAGVCSGGSGRVAHCCSIRPSEYLRLPQHVVLLGGFWGTLVVAAGVCGVREPLSATAAAAASASPRVAGSMAPTGCRTPWGLGSAVAPESPCRGQRCARAGSGAGSAVSHRLARAGPTAAFPGRRDGKAVLAITSQAREIIHHPPSAEGTEANAARQNAPARPCLPSGCQHLCVVAASNRVMF